MNAVDYKTETIGSSRSVAYKIVRLILKLSSLSADKWALNPSDVIRLVRAREFRYTRMSLLNALL